MWSTIPECPMYEASDDGRIRRKDRPDHMLAIRTQESGHRRVSLWVSGRARHLYVHRLVLEAFVGPCPEGMEVRHINGDPGDNRLSNLCYGTRRQNMADRKEHGDQPLGSVHWNAKLDEEQVRSIRADGRPMAVLAREYGVHRITIHDIITRRTWRHVA